MKGWNARTVVTVYVDITEVATGVTATVEWSGDLSSAEFWWGEDGSGGCDCNRSLYHQRGRGVPEALVDWDTPCSEGRFTVVLRES